VADVSAKDVAALRKATGAGMMDCKKALEETGGDEEKAIEILRKKGAASAAKRSGRGTEEGVISSYIHADGRKGALVEVQCETDFVANTDEFKALVKDLAMQVAAAAPRFVTREEVPASEIESERAIYRKQAEATGKPAQVIERIVDGQIERFYKDVCLLEQAFVKQSDRTIGDLVQEAIVRFGVNVAVRRFARYQLGETQSRTSDAKEDVTGGRAGG
jgi:elongation factor Ts